MYTDPAGGIGLGETAFPQQGLDHLDGFGCVELRDRPPLPMVLPSGGDVTNYFVETFIDIARVAIAVINEIEGERE